ncbi:GspH/FimT family pseudopilin [Blastomonas sp. SL216]|uniref:GspH/FimT family pseudopilin n=1 Tax=Blastomonas sp. SL216 TaxID=2995169 RepID=UPI00406A3445
MAHRAVKPRMRTSRPMGLNALKSSPSALGPGLLKSSPSSLGEGDHLRSKWWRGSGCMPREKMCATLPLHPAAARRGPPPRDKLGEDFSSGFTMIELMVVLFIIGLVAGAVVLALPGDSAALSEDADRFAARVAAARDEAVVSARPIAVWIAPSGYGFDARQDRQWVPLNARTLANRDWKPGTMARIEGTVAEGDEKAEDQGRARFWFDSTGLPNMPVTVVLARGTNSDRIVISATGEVGRPK